MLKIGDYFFNEDEDAKTVLNVWQKLDSSNVDFDFCLAKNGDPIFKGEATELRGMPDVLERSGFKKDRQLKWWRFILKKGK